MYVDSWERNHQFSLLSQDELAQSLAVKCYSHYLLIGDFDYKEINELCPDALVFNLNIKPHETFGWQDIDDILVFVGAAFIEDYKFDMVISSDVAERAIGTYLIAKHSTVGENSKAEESYLEKINPKTDKYDTQMIKAYSEATKNKALQDICNKIWRDV